MRACKNIVLILLPTLALAALAGAQTPAPLGVESVIGLSASFDGSEQLGCPALEITVELAAHSGCADDSYLLVRIRDGANPPPFNPTDPEASWTYSGTSERSVIHRLHLPVPAYYRGPVFVDVLMQHPERFGPSIGPMMLPVADTGIVPYGTVDLDRNRLNLLAETGDVAVVPSLIRLRVEGAVPGSLGLIALSPTRTEMTFDMGGRLLIGPWPIWLLPEVFQADERGRFETMLEIPAHQQVAGLTFYVQAVSDAMDGSAEPWHFSNGVQVTLPDLQ
jgi:hypothetical protein